MILQKSYKQKTNKTSLLIFYTTLLNEFGNRNWWPAESQFEVIIGAILTQNVSWNNVKKAITNLKSAKILDADTLYVTDVNEIAPLIKSSRYYNQKSQKIKKFLTFLFNEYNGNLSIMAEEDTAILRKKLLEINGFGEETVDSILLYACNKPIFVVDTYTKRIFSRYGLIEKNTSYKEVQAFFMNNLPQDLQLYNDFHAQIVHLGNSICKSKPECERCPIRKFNTKIKCRFYSLLIPIDLN